MGRDREVESLGCAYRTEHPDVVITVVVDACFALLCPAVTTVFKNRRLHRDCGVAPARARAAALSTRRIEWVVDRVSLVLPGTRPWQQS